MALSENRRIDKHSFTWAAIKWHADKELETARRLLEARGTEHGQSEYLRGKIAALSEILAMPDRDSGHVSE